MAKILCVGETCLDDTYRGRITRLNPDGPGMVFVPNSREVTRGMLGNVIANLQLLDPNGFFVAYHQNAEIRKTRYIDESSGYILPVRVDTGDEFDDRASFDGLDKALNKAQVSLKDFQCILVIDYGKNFLSIEFISELSKQAKNLNIPLMIDTKKTLGTWSKDIYVCKINLKEYNEMLETTLCPEEYVDNLIITMGGRGCKLMSVKPPGLLIKDFNVNSVPVVNLVGAGDTFLSTLAVSTCKGFNLEDSIKFANKASSLKVSRSKIASVLGEEIWGDGGCMAD